MTRAKERNEQILNKFFFTFVQYCWLFSLLVVAKNLKWRNTPLKSPFSLCKLYCTIQYTHCEKIVNICGIGNMYSKVKTNLFPCCPMFSPSIKYLFSIGLFFLKNLGNFFDEYCFLNYTHV